MRVFIDGKEVPSKPCTDPKTTDSVFGFLVGEQWRKYKDAVIDSVFTEYVLWGKDHASIPQDVRTLVETTARDTLRLVAQAFLSALRKRGQEDTLWPEDAEELRLAAQGSVEFRWEGQ